MSSRRAFLHLLLAAPALAAARTAFAQSMPPMAEGGVIEIKNDHERKLFNELQCTCGCPRDAIGTCSCEYAARFRSEVRAMMAEGMTDEQIRADWVRRYGPQALMVPPNTGSNRLLYIAPGIVMAGGAALVVTLLRRFRRADQAKVAAAAAAPAAAAKRDEYDDKLDEELKQLDDE